MNFRIIDQTHKRAVVFIPENEAERCQIQIINEELKNTDFIFRTVQYTGEGMNERCVELELKVNAK